MIVGARKSDVSGLTDAGKVYTYDLAGISDLKEKIKAPDAATYDKFENSVSQSEDPLAVGA